MSSIKCPECGQKVSKSTHNCPNCGNNLSEFIKERNSFKKTLCICITAIFTVSVVCFSVALNMPKVATNTENNVTSTTSQYVNTFDNYVGDTVANNSDGTNTYYKNSVNHNIYESNAPIYNYSSSSSSSTTTRKAATTTATSIHSVEKPTTTKLTTTKPTTNTKPTTTTTTKPTTTKPANNSKNLTLQDFKDYCVNCGVYSGGEYGISTTYKGSDYSFTTNMVFNPENDQLRFEQVDQGKSYRYLALYIEPNTSNYKWQFQWINGSYYMVGEGKAIKNKEISVTSSDEDKYNFMQPYMIYERAGQSMSNDMKTLFVSAAFSDLHTLVHTMNSYFEKNNSHLNMDFFELDI